MTRQTYEVETHYCPREDAFKAELFLLDEGYPVKVFESEWADFEEIAAADALDVLNGHYRYAPDARLPIEALELETAA